MKHYSKHLAVAGVVAGSTFGLGFAASALDVTSARLVNASNEPQNWLMVYGNYGGHMNSGLNQINRTNVKDLKVKFMASILDPNFRGGSEPSWGESSALVDNGFLFINNAQQQVFKMDVRGGKAQLLWVSKDPAIDSSGGSLRSRGMAMLGKNVYQSLSDARLQAIDGDSGQVVWEVSTKAPDIVQYQRHSGAPLAVKDMILVGNAGGDAGGQGWIGAFKAADGAVAWRFLTVPNPGQPGFETWKDDHKAYQSGGGAIWTTGTYDPTMDLVLYGTGNPNPAYDPEFRPGDNLYTNSTVALDVNTGKLKWYFQETPNESWDYDTVNPKLLYDVPIGGQMRKVQGNFSRDGFFYTLDRASGAFISGTPYVEVTWTKGLDPKTGMPMEYVPGRDLQDYGVAAIRRAKPNQTARDICPYHTLMPTFFPPSYDARRMVAYTSHGVGCANYNIDKPTAPDADLRYPAKGKVVSPKVSTRGAFLGQIAGVDVRTGETVVKTITPYPLYSGLLGTAGDLLFTGHPDGKFAAYDKDSLSELWAFDAGTPINANAISYLANGKQYIAILVGGVNRDYGYPELRLLPRNANLVVFGL